MALNITNINDLKTAKVKIMEARKNYEDTIKLLTDAVKSTEISWQGEDAYNFRHELLTIINNDLLTEQEEMDFEIQFLDKVSSTLENAQQEVKKRLSE